MGDVGDFLFGSSEDPKLEQQMTTKTGGQIDLLNKLTKLLNEQLGNGVPSYPGTMTAQPSDLEKQSWAQISDLLGGGLDTKQAGTQDAISKILAGSGDIPKYDVGQFDPTAIKQWYNDALVKPALQTWESEVVPKVQEHFIGQNAGSSAAANRAITGSAQDLLSSLDSQVADKLFGEKTNFDTRAFNAGMQNMQNEFNAGQNDLQRLLQIPGMESTSMNDLFKAIGLGETAGATERGIDQSGLTEAYQKWLTSQGYSNPWLNLISPALNTSTFENLVNPGSQQAGLLQTLIGPVMGAAGKAGGFGNLFS